MPARRHVFGWKRARDFHNLQISHGRKPHDVLIPALPTMSLAPGIRLGVYEGPRFGVSRAFVSDG